MNIVELKMKMNFGLTKSVFIKTLLFNQEGILGVTMLVIIPPNVDIMNRVIGIPSRKVLHHHILDVNTGEGYLHILLGDKLIQEFYILGSVVKYANTLGKSMPHNTSFLLQMQCHGFV